MAMSRLRAVEHGRAVLIAATSGISAIITPDGRVTQSLPEFTAGYLEQQVPLRDSLTLSDRVGAVPEIVASLAAIVLIAVAAFGRRRRWDIGSTLHQPSEESHP
jgi:apolipoprotein N-acyltransferase